MALIDSLSTFLSNGAAGGIAAALVIGIWGNYVREKGKNLATKQDIGEITKAVEAVKLEYASALETAKSELVFQSVQRERAEQVAELIVEWLSRPKDRRRLNELTIKVTMWLPDREAKELNNLLAWKQGVSTRQVISSIRRFIQGKETDIGPAEITLFSMDENDHFPSSPYLPLEPINLEDMVEQVRIDCEKTKTGETA